MMLEGKAPIDHSALANITNDGSQGSIKERIVYRDPSGKEIGGQLEEELKHKENQLRSEQEEKALLQDKLSELQKHFETKGPAKSDEKELERIKKLKEKLKSQKRKEEEYLK